MKNNILISLLATFALLASFLVAFPVSAASGPSWQMGGRPSMQGHMPGVFGTVSAVDGTTLTVTSKGFGQNATPTTYTVNASNATVTKNGAASTLENVMTGDTVMVQGTVSGTNVTATTIRDGVMPGNHSMMMGGMGIFGTVASTNGTDSLTVTSKARPNAASATPTTYTVNATNVTVTKNGAASSMSAIAVGDTVMIQGTISGTTVTATTIRDGMPQSGAQPAIQGNGQPVVAGKVTAINGSTLTITNSSNVTYTIDATNAKFSVKGTATATISNVSVGDNVIVQGTVNGNSVTASSVIDQKPMSSATSASGSAPKPQMGIMGSITNFFKHLFGF